MKNIFVYCLVVSLCLPSFAFEGVCDPNSPLGCSERFPAMGDNAVTKDIPLDYVFAPKGLDNNDRAEVIGVGWLPSPCYQAPIGKAYRSGTTLRVSAQATLSMNRVCVPMAVPYLVSIHLGTLEQESYLVQYTDENHELKATVLNIEQAATDKTDNFVYAHVERVEADEVNKKILLSGRNPSDCYELDRIETIYNDRDTYAILPIMKQIKEDCPRKLVSFQYSIDMPKKMTSQKILWHVRRVDGKSVNLTWDRHQGFSY